MRREFDRLMALAAGTISAAGGEKCLRPVRRAIGVGELKKGHVKNWMENHANWKSPATFRSAIGIALAAFNRDEEDFGIANPLEGSKEPRSEPRLQSLSQADEEM